MDTTRLPTMRFARLDRVAVVVHGTEPPSEADWAVYLDELWSAEAPVEHARTLVLTEGGSPDTLQRGSLTSRVHGYVDMSTAVVSPRRAVGLVVTALSWFFKGIKFFGPDDIAKATAHLGLTEAERDAAIAAAIELVDQESSFDWKRRLLAVRHTTH